MTSAGFLWLRRPYVGDGADGAYRSAQIDLEEADTLPLGEQRDQCLLSAERWLLEADTIEAASVESDRGDQSFDDASGEWP